MIQPSISIEGGGLACISWAEWHPRAAPDGKRASRARRAVSFRGDAVKTNYENSAY